MYRLYAKLRNLRYHFRTANYDVIEKYRSVLGGGYLQYVACSWRYGASFEDYYELGFYRMKASERRRWITTSLRHEITRQLNSETDAPVLRDKKLFIDTFSKLLGRSVWCGEAVSGAIELEQPGNLVIKHRFGQAGRRIYFPDTFRDRDQLLSYLDALPGHRSDYVAEQLIDQHEEMARLDPTAVSTLRIVTLLKGESVDLFGVVLRMSTGARIDNLAAGGIAAWVDPDGIVRKEAVFKDALKSPVSVHPVSGEAIVGFRIPYFKEAVELACSAARMVPAVRSIGWDIAIGPQGPCLIEGNDNWCKTVLQLPLGKGLRDLAESACDMTLVYR